MAGGGAAAELQASFCWKASGHMTAGTHGARRRGKEAGCHQVASDEALATSVSILYPQGSRKTRLSSARFPASGSCLSRFSRHSGYCSLLFLDLRPAGAVAGAQSCAEVIHTRGDRRLEPPASEVLCDWIIAPIVNSAGSFRQWSFS